MDLGTTETLRTVIDLVQEQCSGKTLDIGKKASSTTTKNMDMAKKGNPTEMCTKVSSKTAKRRAKVNIFGHLKLTTREITKIIKWMDKEFCSGRPLNADMKVKCMQT